MGVLGTFYRKKSSNFLNSEMVIFLPLIKNIHQTQNKHGKCENQNHLECLSYAHSMRTSTSTRSGARVYHLIELACSSFPSRSPLAPISPNATSNERGEGGWVQPMLNLFACDRCKIHAHRSSRDSSIQMKCTCLHDKHCDTKLRIFILSSS